MNQQRNLKRNRDGAQSQRKRKKGSKGQPVKVTTHQSEEPLEDGDDDDVLEFDDPFLDEIIQKPRPNMPRPKQQGMVPPPPRQMNQRVPPPIPQQGEIFNPTTDKLGPDEKLIFHNDAYTLFHRFTSTWPIPSFDIISRPQFLGNHHFPYELFMVSSSQVKDRSGRPGMNPNSGRPERCHFNTWRLHNMHKTTHDSDDDDDPTLEDDENLLEDPNFNREKTNVPGNLGDQNRIRVMPQRPPVALMYGDGGRFGIYDLTPLLAKVTDVGNMRHMHAHAKVIHLSKERIPDGFGCDWSRVTTGLFGLGGYGRMVRIYRLDEGGQVNSMANLVGHGDHVEDIQFSPSEGNVLASSGCDKSIIVWDLRQKKPGMKVRNVSTTDVNVISWNRIDNFYLASGDDEGYLKVWDLRQLYQPSASQGTVGKKGKKGVWLVDHAVPAAQYRFHKKAITSVEWNPVHTSVLATTSEEDICVVWDLSAEQVMDGPPLVGRAGTAVRPPPAQLRGIPEQVMFIHQGQEMMKEVHWHPQYENLLVSCGNNTIHVFQPFNLRPQEILPPKVDTGDELDGELEGLPMIPVDDNIDLLGGDEDEDDDDDLGNGLLDI